MKTIRLDKVVIAAQSRVLYKPSSAYLSDLDSYANLDLGNAPNQKFGTTLHSTLALSADVMRYSSSNFHYRQNLIRNDIWYVNSGASAAAIAPLTTRTIALPQTRIMGQIIMEPLTPLVDQLLQVSSGIHPRATANLWHPRQTRWRAVLAQSAIPAALILLSVADSCPRSANCQPLTMLLSPTDKIRCWDCCHVTPQMLPR